MNLVVLFRHANFNPIRFLFNIQEMGGIQKYIRARCPFVLHVRHTRQGGIKFEITHCGVICYTLKYLGKKKRKFLHMKWGCVMIPYV